MTSSATELQSIDAAIARAAERLTQDEYTVRLDFFETLLGSRPTTNIAARHVRAREEEAIRQEYRSGRRVSPHLDRKAAKGEADDIAKGRIEGSTGGEDTGDDEDDREHLAVTGFSTHPDTGYLHLWDFQIMGALKAIAGTLDIKIPGKRVEAISARSQIQNLVWVFAPRDEGPGGRRLYLRRDDAYFEDADGLMDRPLRAQTAKGERISIAVSEQIDPPAWVEFRILTIRGCKLKQEQFEDILSYLVIQGLGQWRGAGWGRCTHTIEKVR